MSQEGAPMQTIQKPEILVAGITCRTSNAPEDAMRDIPQLWMQFFVKNIPGLIPNKTSDKIVALYCDYEGDYTKPYTLLIGYPVSSIEGLPEPIEHRIIPAGTYAQFPVEGEHPQGVINTWGQIWQTPLNRTYTGDYELYGQGVAQGKPEEVDIFIAIKP